MNIKSCIKFIYENKLNIIILLIWLIIAITAMITHEVGYWDELRPLLLIKEHNFKTLLYLIQTDGHPYLWYFILYPFVKLNFHETCMQIISLIFVFSSIILLFIKSKFNILLKIFIAFSAGMIYYMGIIPRCYSLIPFFIFLIAVLYPKRSYHPFLYFGLLVLLSQTHTYSWGFCFICSLIFLYEKIKEYIISVNKKKFELITLILLFLAYCSYMIYTYTGVLFLSKEKFVNLLKFKSIIFAEPISLNLKNIIQESKVFNYLTIYGKIYIISLLAYVGVLFKIDKKSFLILFFSMIYFLVFWFFIYTGGVYYQKFYIFFLFLIFSYWISKKNIISTSLITIMFFITFLNPFFIEYIKDEIYNKFTNTKEICMYLKNNNIPNDKIVIVTEADCIKDDYRFYKYIYDTTKIPLYAIYNKDDENVNKDKIDEINNIIKNNPKIKYVIAGEGVLNYFDFEYETENTLEYKQCNVIKYVYNFGRNYILKLKKE